MLDTVEAFFACPPLTAAEARRAEQRTRTAHLRDDVDPLAGLDEHQERAISERAR